MRGAVIQGLADIGASGRLGFQIESRIARCNYGIMYHVPWSSFGQFNPRDKKWNAKEQCFMAVNQVKWLLTEVRKPLFDLYPVLGQQPQADADIA
jgi:hypothetical protein